MPAEATRELRKVVWRDAAAVSERPLLVAEAFREREREVYHRMRAAKARRADASG